MTVAGGGAEGAPRCEFIDVMESYRFAWSKTEPICWVDHHKVDHPYAIERKDPVRKVRKVD